MRPTRSSTGEQFVSTLPEQEPREAQHADPNFLPHPQVLGAGRERPERTTQSSIRLGLAFKDDNRTTDVRTMIAAIVPQVRVGTPFTLTSDSGRST